MQPNKSYHICQKAEAKNIIGTKVLKAYIAGSRHSVNNVHNHLDITLKSQIVNVWLEIRVLDSTFYIGIIKGNILVYMQSLLLQVPNATSSLFLCFHLKTNMLKALIDLYQPSKQSDLA